MIPTRTLTFAVVVTALAGGVGRTQPSDPPPAVVAALSAGYLTRETLPNSLSLLPPPPAAGSADQGRDDDAARAALALEGSPRWARAVADAKLRFPDAAQSFACTVGVRIDGTATPRLYDLLRRSEADLALSTYPTKIKYQRARPFTVNKAPICTPDDEAFLRGDGSYPSGHSTVGWGWALILAEAAPDRADSIMARGRAFGASRVVCNVHWLSDTEEGRVMAAATVARLHAEPAFRADLAAAHEEIATARKSAPAPGGDCAGEEGPAAAY